MGKPHGISIIALFIQVWIIILIILNYSPLFCVWISPNPSIREEGVVVRVREGELPHDAEMRVYAAHPFYLGDIFHNRQTDVYGAPAFSKSSRQKIASVRVSIILIRTMRMKECEDRA